MSGKLSHLVPKDSTPKDTPSYSNLRFNGEKEETKVRSETVSRVKCPHSRLLRRVFDRRENEGTGKPWHLNFSDRTTLVQDKEPGTGTLD